MANTLSIEITCDSSLDNNYYSDITIITTKYDGQLSDDMIKKIFKKACNNVTNNYDNNTKWKLLHWGDINVHRKPNPNEKFIMDFVSFNLECKLIKGCKNSNKSLEVRKNLGNFSNVVILTNRINYSEYCNQKDIDWKKIPILYTDRISEELYTVIDNEIGFHPEVKCEIISIDNQLEEQDYEILFKAHIVVIDNLIIFDKFINIDLNNKEDLKKLPRHLINAKNDREVRSLNSQRLLHILSRCMWVQRVLIPTTDTYATGEDIKMSDTFIALWRDHFGGNHISEIIIKNLAGSCEVCGFSTSTAKTMYKNEHNIPDVDCYIKDAKDKLISICDKCKIEFTRCFMSAYMTVNPQFIAHDDNPSCLPVPQMLWNIVGDHITRCDIRPYSICRDKDTNIEKLSQDRPFEYLYITKKNMNNDNH